MFYFQILSKNETCWVKLSAPNCYEIFDLVGVDDALYCIGRQNEDSVCMLISLYVTKANAVFAADNLDIFLGYDLERYDTTSDCWFRVSTFSLSSNTPQVKALCLENMLAVTSGEQWLMCVHCVYFINNSL